MNRSSIIANLVTCLSGIATGEGFATTPKEIKRGIYLAEEMNDLPAISIFNERVDTEDLTNSTAERVLVMHVWGAARAPHGDYTQMDGLMSDCLQALSRPDMNPHWNETIVTNLEVYEGGAGDPLGLFDLELKVGYETGLTEI